jgi:hypothetical protein
MIDTSTPPQQAPAPELPKLVLSQRLYDKLTQRRPMPLSARIERER